MARVCFGIGHMALMFGGILGGLTLAGTGARADFWSPGVTLGTRFDSPGTSPTGGGTWVGDITPQVLFERLGPFTNWDIRVARRYDTGNGSGGLRVNNDVASLSIHSQPAEHTSVALQGWYFRSRDVLHPDPEAQLAASTMTRGSGSASVAFWRAEAGYQHEVISHQAAQLVDGRSRSWNAALFPFRSELSQWVLGWYRDEWAVQGNNELSTSAATLGVRRQHTPGLASELEVGVARVTDDLGASRREVVAVIAGLDGFGQALGLPFDARVRVEHDVTTTGVAEIWRPMAGKRVAVKWERKLQPVGGVIQQVARRDFVSVEAVDTLGGRSIVSLEGSYRLATPRIGSGDRIETYRAMATVSRDLRTWLRGRVRYARAHQVGRGTITTSDFESDRVEVSLTAVYQ